MAWQVPPTFADGTLLTASQLNILSNDLNETSAAKATAAGRYFATTGVDAVAERVPSSGVISTAETTGSTTYGHLATIGPDCLNVTTGPRALVILSTACANSTVGSRTYMSYEISSATTQAANDPESLEFDSRGANDLVSCSWAWLENLTAGNNSFRALYRVNSGTGTWTFRRITVLPF